MGLISLLFKDPAAFLILTIPLLYSVIIHEISHGWVARLFGDDTAAQRGRLSLNPVSHLDPVGTLALLLVGFGWAKPVPIDYSKVRNFRAGLICISLAGCAANICIAMVSLAMLQFAAINTNPLLFTIFVVLAKINITLGALNLIPIPPLDGSRILLGILPQRAQMVLLRIEPYGMILLFGLLFTGALNPIMVFIQNIIIAVIKFILRV